MYILVTPEHTDLIETRILEIQNGGFGMGKRIFLGND